MECTVTTLEIQRIVEMLRKCPIRVVHDIPVGPDWYFSPLWYFHIIPVGPIRVIYDVSVSSVVTVHSTVTLFREGK